MKNYIGGMLRSKEECTDLQQINDKLFDLSHKLMKDNKNIYRQGRCWNVKWIQEKHRGQTSSRLDKLTGAVS